MPAGYAVETISSLPFGHLIGGPLTAAIDAQALGAKATVDFIQDVGFIPPNPDEDSLFPTPGAQDAAGQPLVAGDFGQVRMITFTYIASSVPQVDNAGNPVLDAAGNRVLGPGSVTLTVPLLTVVPIPYLAISEMTIDFVAKISESITATRKAADNRRLQGSSTAKGGWGPVSGSLKASYSSTHTSSSERSSKYQTELTMSIHVRATSESMPKGLGRMLDILEKAIIPG